MKAKVKSTRIVRLLVAAAGATILTLCHNMLISQVNGYENFWTTYLPLEVLFLTAVGGWTYAVLMNKKESS
jgi:hypothetical protein